MPRRPSRPPRSRRRGPPAARGPRGGPRPGPEGARGAAPRFEIEHAEGLEPFVRDELRALGARVLDESGGGGTGEIRVAFDGPPAALTELRRAAAAYRLETFDAPRPKALLGDAALRRLAALLEGVLEGGRFRGFRFGAAGAGSPAFLRLAEALEARLGLPFDPEAGELLIRFRPAAEGRGWDVLPRLTPRPLSARAWRACNREGGLNAALAAAAWDLVGARAADRVWNPMCGSGTLLVERAAAGPFATLAGGDLDPEAVACARRNLEAAGLAERAPLTVEDATASGRPDASADVVCADLPWGDDVGSSAANAGLYPAFLAEAARAAAPGARLLAVTHEIRLWERVVGGQDAWRPESGFRAFHGGHRPLVAALVRRG